MTVQVEFEKSFHSISGITISERRKNLYELLNKVKICQNEIDFASVVPKTALEDVFRVETLLFFRKTDDLLKVLCGDNEVLIQRVLNASDWFINSAFANVTGEELVTKIFPNISYNTKLKLLNKIAKFSPSVHQSDEYFEAVKSNYGLFLATKLLESCSEQLILQCIKKYKVEITPRQLLTIVKKYPKITENILELLEKQNYKTPINIKYTNVYLYLSQKDGALFLKLFDKYKPELWFRNRRTKSFILQNKTYVIKNSQKLHELLKNDQIYKNIPDDFEEYLYNMFPKSFQKFQDVFIDKYSSPLMQKSLPKTKQFYLLIKLFKRVFEEEIWNFPSFVTCDLLKLMSSDDREVWMQKHTKPNGWKEETWISLMRTEKAIPWLIEKISLTSNVENRERLIMALVDTCDLNNDLDALLRVLEYVAEKHRNDDVNMREHFLIKVHCCFYKSFQKFSEKHWMYFMKLVRSFLMDNNYYACIMTGIFDEYVSYRYLHNFDIYDLVLEWVKQRTYTYNLCTEVPECEKLFLRIIAEVIPKVFVQKCDLDDHYTSYLSAVHDYNKRNLKDRMSFFENLNAIQSMKKQLLDSDSITTSTEFILKGCLKFEFTLSLETGLVKEYFKRRENKQDIFFNSFLKHHPETFAAVVLPFLEKRCKLYNLHFLKYYEHLGIPQQFVQTKASIHADSLRPDEIQCLSHTMRPNRFLTLIAAYFPRDFMESCDIETEKKIYELQRVAILSLKNLISPEAALSCLLNFCQGDYLQLSVSSLHLLCENLSENKIADFVNALSNREFSARMHSIHLAFRLLNRTAIGEFVEKLLQKEENMSIRKCILKATFKLFLNTQELSDFELVKTNVKAIDLEDAKAYNVITNNIEKVSPKCFKEFILFIWDILENVQNPDKANIRGKCRILNAINEWNIGLLPTEFCVRLIENYLFKSTNNKLEILVEAFASKFIIHHNLQEFEHRIRFVLSIAQAYVQTNWYNNMKLCTNRRLFISKFVVQFSKSFMSKKCKNVNIIESFLKIWRETFPPWKMFNEFLHLSFTLLYVKSIEQNSSILEIGESLGKLCNDFHSEENLNVIVFCRVFETFKSHFESIFEDPIECCLLMAEGILAKNTTSSGFMLAMCLLPDVDKVTKRNKEKCSSIFNLIVGQKDSNVRIFVHQHCLSKVTMNE